VDGVLPKRSAVIFACRRYRAWLLETCRGLALALCRPHTSYEQVAADKSSIATKGGRHARVFDAVDRRCRPDIHRSAHGQTIDWEKVDAALGRRAAVTEDVHRYGFLAAI
jgi:hypothetical protein